jgi:TPR repeat protein
MYYLGLGMPADYACAAWWERQSAEQGFVEAQYDLGTIYQNGAGVQRSYAQAYLWYEIAARAGDREAAAARDFIAQFLIADEVTQAQKLASEWQPKRAAATAPSLAPHTPERATTSSMQVECGR